MVWKRELEKGWINVHIHVDTKEVVTSRKPYLTKEEAEKGFYHGLGIEKVGCFEIEYSKFPYKEIS